MSTHRIVFIVSAVAVLAACAAQPQARKPIAQVPPLEPKESRVYLTSGMLNRGDPQAHTLSSLREVGPVYVDGKYAGDIAQNEFIVLDLTPGVHDVSCSPIEPVRNYIEPRHVIFEPGKTQSLVCDMASGRGDLSGNFQSKTWVEQRTIDLQQGAVVGYSKLP